MQELLVVYDGDTLSRDRVQASAIRLLSIGDPAHAVNYLGLQDRRELCVLLGVKNLCLRTFLTSYGCVMRQANPGADRGAVAVLHGCMEVVPVGPAGDIVTA